MFKEAEFTPCQASFQAVLPTEDDVSTVNDTCPKNKQFFCTAKYKELKRIFIVACFMVHRVGA
jgi:hypothetical protein